MQPLELATDSPEPMLFCLGLGQGCWKRIWRFSSVVEHLPSKHGVLGLGLSSENKKDKITKKGAEEIAEQLRALTPLTEF